jgi:hypothetical protein
MLLIDSASGHTAAIWHEGQKLTRKRMGLIWLGDDFDDLVPQIFLGRSG